MRQDISPTSPAIRLTFKVGDVVRGSAVAQAFMSPVTLISGATDETNVTVTNIAKFLQTVDDDNNPSNGIQITSGIHSAAVGRTINFAHEQCRTIQTRQLRTLMRH